MSFRNLPVSLNCKLAYNLPVVKQQRRMLHQTHGKSVRLVSTQLWQVTTGFLIRSWLKHALASDTSHKVFGVQLLATPAGSSCNLKNLNNWPILATCFTPCWSSASVMSVSVLNLMTTSSVCGQT